MGVVNNRIDIDALEKSSGGGGGGFTMEKIFDGNVVQGSTTVYELSTAYTEYTFLVATAPSAANPDFGKIMVVDDIANGTNNLNPSGIVNLRFDAEDATKFTVPQGTGTKAIKIYGCK